MSLFRFAPVVLLTAAISACNNPVEVEESEPGYVRVSIGDLEQTVQITPRRPKVGETIRIGSLIINRGHDQVRITKRDCALEIGGTLELQRAPVYTCGSVSSEGDLAAGDSTGISSHSWRVSSESGQYYLRVRHLLDPDVWVTVPVVVEAE